jgi:PHD/YefM family antitoxin component YafN of YafNO toxin-antitoxin module
MIEPDHQKQYDVKVIASNLGSLHEYVALSNARIEISHGGSDQNCVLLSRQELDSLERALEILSQSETAREARERIVELASATGPLVPAGA